MAEDGQRHQRQDQDPRDHATEEVRRREHSAQDRGQSREPGGVAGQVRHQRMQQDHHGGRTCGELVEAHRAVDADPTAQRLEAPGRDELQQHHGIGHQREAHSQLRQHPVLARTAGRGQGKRCQRQGEVQRDQRCRVDAVHESAWRGREAASAR
jgi:hypothetical protein